MARKEFKYRGYTTPQLQELSLNEFVQLLPSRERRTLQRGFTHPEQNLLNKLEKRDKVKTHERQMVILPNMVGKTILVHNGKGYEEIHIQEEMVAHRLGQFSHTRRKAGHNKGGTGKK
jgi:small subunit ribosomal protein S19